MRELIGIIPSLYHNIGLKDMLELDELEYLLKQDYVFYKTNKLKDITLYVTGVKNEISYELTAHYVKVKYVNRWLIMDFEKNRI
jgi:hypothetical protein